MFSSKENYRAQQMAPALQMLQAVAAGYDVAMFPEEPPEARMRHLWSWQEPPPALDRTLSAWGLMPLKLRCGTDWMFYINADVMEAFSAQLSLTVLLPKYRSLIVQTFKKTTDRVVHFFLQYLVATPLLSNSKAVHEAKSKEVGNDMYWRWRSHEDEPTKQDDEVYYTYLELGPVPLLEALLSSGEGKVLSKLKADPLWQSLKPQLTRIANGTNCPTGLRKKCLSCVEMIQKPHEASCAVCGCKGKLRRCSGCDPKDGGVFYCGVEHQRQDWKYHKKSCARICVPRKPPQGSDLERGKYRLLLQKAVNKQDVNAIQELFKKGAHPDSILENDWVALHVCAVQGRASVAQVFLKNGADPNIKNGHQETPLLLAVMYGQLDVAELLVKYGAETDVSNRHGIHILQHVGQFFDKDDTEKNEKFRTLLLRGKHKKHNDCIKK